MRKRACTQKRHRKRPQHTRRKPLYARDSSVRSRVARPQTRAPQGAAPRRGQDAPESGRLKGFGKAVWPEGQTGRFATAVDELKIRQRHRDS